MYGEMMASPRFFNHFPQPPRLCCPLTFTCPSPVGSAFRKSIVCCTLRGVGCAFKVLWDLIKEQGADEDGDNRISEDEFVRLGMAGEEKREGRRRESTFRPVNRWKKDEEGRG